MRLEINRIRSKNHNIDLYRINKITLSSYDYKTYILKDVYSRLSYYDKSTR